AFPPPVPARPLAPFPPRGASRAEGGTNLRQTFASRRPEAQPSPSRKPAAQRRADRPHLPRAAQMSAPARVAAGEDRTADRPAPALSERRRQDASAAPAGRKQRRR